MGVSAHVVDMLMWFLKLMDVSAHVVDMLMWFLKFDGVRYAKSNDCIVKTPCFPGTQKFIGA